jgi:hypothetical protein
MAANRILRSTLLFLVALLLPAFSHANDDSTAIIQATTDYVKKEASVNDPLVTVDKIVEGYARVQVKSKSGATDTATAFLKLSKGRWKVLTMGTAFAPEDYKKLGIPVPLQE